MIQAAKLQVEVNADTRDAERGIDSFDDRLRKATRSAASAGLGMTAGITAPLLGIASAVFNAGSTFESAFTDVIKTVNATDSQIAGLRDGILDMSREIPLSADAIASVAAAAGQLGIETENILDFTRVMADLGVTTNLTAEQAATSLARFANITQMPQTEFERLGSTIVDLGNNLATTEAEIVEMALRIAGAGSQIGLTESEILGFSAALSSVGIAAEAGGSAISRVMIDMANNVAAGNAELSIMADVAGMTSTAFSELFKTDPSAALLGFIEGLDDISRAGGNVFKVLDDLGLGEIRVRDALLRAAGAGDLFRQSLEIASTAWQENIALSNEAALRYGTVESKLQLMANGLSLIGIAMYDHVRPMISETLGAVNEGISSLITVVQGLSPEMVNAGLAFAGVFAAAGPLLLVIAGLGAALGFLLSPIGLVVTATAALAAAWVADVGGIQEITATAFGAVQEWFASTSTAAAALGNSITTAFSNTSFPSLESLWEQFKGGDFQTVADTIRDTAYDLMVNLDTELNITAQAKSLDSALIKRAEAVRQYEIDAISSWSESLGDIDWSTAFDFAADILDGMTTSVDSIDWNAAGEGFIAFITEPFQNLGTVTENVGAAITNLGMTLGTGLDSLGVSLSGASSLMGEWLSTTAGDISTAWADAGMGTAFSNLATSLDSALSGLLTGARAAIAAQVTSAFGGLGESLAGLWTDFTISAPEFNWQDFIPETLSWSAFIPNALSWDAFIVNLAWSGFIPDINWGSFIPDFGWGDFVPDLNWGRFIPALFGGGSSGSSSSSSGGSGGGGSINGGVPYNAMGTDYFGGGMTWVGERGPELVSLPQGSRIYNNRESMEMAGGGMNVNVYIANVASDIDVESMVNKVVRKMQQRVR